MNTIWSDYIQGTDTLYLTRQLRFDDHFRDQYIPHFALDEKKKLRILEIGCGPGALAAALHRWYPEAEIVALDRDSRFISFAREHVHGATFVEGDAACLPFENNSFDVTISNTVSEHIEPSAFYTEQMRVLKNGGTCLVLSARKGINLTAACLKENEYEHAFWEKVNALDHSMEEYQICRYPMTESEMPLAMENYGFTCISTAYAVIPLTPDNPEYSAEMALRMINAGRACALDAVNAACKNLKDHISREEADEVTAIINQKYDQRIKLYLNGQKCWNTNVSLTMILRGVKTDISVKQHIADTE